MNSPLGTVVFPQWGSWTCQGSGSPFSFPLSPGPFLWHNNPCFHPGSWFMTWVSGSSGSQRLFSFPPRRPIGSGWSSGLPCIVRSRRTPCMPLVSLDPGWKVWLGLVGEPGWVWLESLAGFGWRAWLPCIVRSDCEPGRWGCDPGPTVIRIGGDVIQLPCMPHSIVSPKGAL